jgi:hypothetical protein
VADFGGRHISYLQGDWDSQDEGPPSDLLSTVTAPRQTNKIGNKSMYIHIPTNIQIRESAWRELVLEIESFCNDSRPSKPHDGRLTAALKST